MNFMPIPNMMPINNMDNQMYMNEILNRFNEFDNRLKMLEQRIMKLEKNTDNLDYQYQEPDNSFYMI